MLVQFVSDLSVTSDGFLAHYSSVPRGTEISTDDVSRSIPPIPPVKPVEPRQPATTTQPPAPSVKYEPTPKPRPVQPSRSRERENTGKDTRVPVSRPNGNGKRPGRWSWQLVLTKRWRFWSFFKSLLFFSLAPQNPLCAKACKRDGTIKSSFCASEFGKFPLADQPTATWQGFTLSAFPVHFIIAIIATYFYNMKSTSCLLCLKETATTDRHHWRYLLAR